MAKHVCQRYLKSINVALCHFDRTRSNGAREFFRQVMAEKWKSPNPSIETSMTLHMYDEPPKVTLSLIDGSTSSIVLGRGSVAEYLEELENRTRQVEQAMVDKGVPLPTADPMASGSLSATGKKKK